MPLYLYRREDGTTFEYRQKFSDDALVSCPATGQAVHRIPQASGIIFKGSGFYVNDNKTAAKPSPTPATSDKTETATAEATATATKTETPKTQSKSDAAD